MDVSGSRTRVATILVALGMLAGACTHAGSHARSDRPSLTWKDCGADFSCARLAVPVDYSRPEAGSAGLRLIRHPASGSSIGTLVVTAGGVGGTGAGWLRRNLALLGRLSDRFDVVSFDPRGSGHSDPIRCPQALLDRYLSLDPTPDGRAATRSLLRAGTRYVSSCKDAAGGLFDHLDLTTQARDVEWIRAALGERAITFLGLSSGADVGAALEARAPHRVRAIVLDAPDPPGTTALQFVTGRALGMERSLVRFLGTCNQDCPLTLTEDRVPAVRRLMARLSEHPLKVGSERLTGAEAYYGLEEYLDDPRGWPLLDDALHDAMHGDGSALLRGFDVYMRSSAPGYQTTMPDYYGSVCADYRWPTEASTYSRWAARLQTRAPVFGAEMVWQHLPCLKQTRSASSASPSASPSPGALVVAATNDPLVDYRRIRSFAHRTGSAFLTRLGVGHTSYFESACVRDEIAAFLTALMTPKPGTDCPSDYGPGPTG